MEACHCYVKNAFVQRQVPGRVQCDEKSVAARVNTVGLVAGARNSLYRPGRKVH